MAYNNSPDAGQVWREISASEINKWEKLVSGCVVNTCLQYLIVTV